MSNEWPLGRKISEESPDLKRLSELKTQRDAIDKEITEIESRLNLQGESKPTGPYSDRAIGMQAEYLQQLESAARDPLPSDILSELALIWAHHEADLKYTLEPSVEEQQLLSERLSAIAPGYELYWTGKPESSEYWYNYVMVGVQQSGVQKIVRVNFPGLTFQGKPVVPARIYLQ